MAAVRLGLQGLSLVTRNVRKLMFSKLMPPVMLKFFDYVYYGIYKLYKNASDSSPEFAASCAVSGFQAFNILSIIMLYDIIIEKREEVNASKLFWVILIVVLIILNYFRYIQIDKFSHKKIKTQWDMKTLQNKVVIRSLIVSYILISTLLFFGLVFYFGSKKT
jgi:hypothetical protein